MNCFCAEEYTRQVDGASPLERKNWCFWLTEPEVPLKGLPGLELLLRLHVALRDGTSEN